MITLRIYCSSMIATRMQNNRFIFVFATEVHEMEWMYIWKVIAALNFNCMRFLLYASGFYHCTQYCNHEGLKVQYARALYDLTLLCIVVMMQHCIYTRTVLQRGLCEVLNYEAALKFRWNSYHSYAHNVIFTKSRDCMTCLFWADWSGQNHQTEHI